MTTITIPMDREYVDDLIDMAGYAIGYWALTAEVTPAGYTVTQDDDGTVHRLSREDIWAARCKIIGGQAGQISPQIVGWLASGDAGDVDADCADVVIQIAALGEIVYG